LILENDMIRYGIKNKVSIEGKSLKSKSLQTLGDPPVISNFHSRSRVLKLVDSQELPNTDSTFKNGEETRLPESAQLVVKIKGTEKVLPNHRGEQANPQNMLDASWNRENQLFKKAASNVTLDELSLKVGGQKLIYDPYLNTQKED
jgi:hypothetical protein